MKVSELTGFELDYWVAKAEGLKPFFLEDDCCVLIGFASSTDPADSTVEPVSYAPSVAWEDGGQIIDREKISINQDMDATADADRTAFAHMPDKVWKGCFGATALVAAMRCFVASRFGDEVGE